MASLSSIMGGRARGSTHCGQHPLSSGSQATELGAECLGSAPIEFCVTGDAECPGAAPIQFCVTEWGADCRGAAPIESWVTRGAECPGQHPSSCVSQEVRSAPTAGAHLGPPGGGLEGSGSRRQKRTDSQTGQTGAEAQPAAAAAAAECEGKERKDITAISVGGGTGLQAATPAPSGPFSRAPGTRMLPARGSSPAPALLLPIQPPSHGRGVNFKYFPPSVFRRFWKVTETLKLPRLCFSLVLKLTRTTWSFSPNISLFSCHFSKLMCPSTLKQDLPCPPHQHPPLARAVTSPSPGRCPRVEMGSPHHMSQHVLAGHLHTS